MIRSLPSISRRQALRQLGTASLIALAGCSTDQLWSDPKESVTPQSPPSESADTTVQLTASSGTVTPAANASSTTWLYNDQFPGPELRVSEGDVFQGTLRNDLSTGTTIHWHGIPLANPMDGVPDVTQASVESEGRFTYKYRAEPAGTFMYHSHVGLQLDRGLLGPLIIEEQDPHVDYDREHVLLLDDYLAEDPQPLSEQDSGPGQDGSPGQRGPGRGGDRDRGGMMGMFDRRPPYEGLLINGQLPRDPPHFSVEEGERVRLRFINASSTTLFKVQIAGHQPVISHADGQPVEPAEADSFMFGSGERYDVILEANNPGTWEITATTIDGNEAPARGILQYKGVDRAASPQSPTSGGRLLNYRDLHAKNPLDVNGQPDRTFDLALTGRRGGTVWTIDGEPYPDADPLAVQPGEHVRVRMVNHSPLVHPMHLHGHFFQVGDAVKDTVLVPQQMGEVTFDFIANNPGDWLFHCHNLYHLEAGMARVITYVR